MAIYPHPPMHDLQSQEASALDQHDLALAHENLLAYSTRMWPAFESERHHALIASCLHHIAQGKRHRVIINMPPRHGKSLLCTENFPAWYLGRHPTHKVISVAYSESLAMNFGRKVRNQLTDPLYQRIFPHCQISQDSQAKHEFHTLAGGEYHATGVGGPLTGKGAHLLIIDDPIKNREEAESPTYREKLKDWYRSTAYTRLEPNGAIIIIQTRWHTDDLTGWLLREHAHEDWFVLTLPAIDEDTDEPLWKERFSLAALQEIKHAIGPFEWNALYQQQPVARDGNVLQDKHWRYWSELPDSKNFIQSWDLTFKDTKSRGSYVVGQVWMKQGPNCYLVDQVRRRMGFRDTVQAILRMSEQYPAATKKYIEDKANGPAIIDVLKGKIPGVIPVAPQGSKLERANAVTYLLEGGNLYLPDPAQHPWVRDLVTECAQFPNGKNDDQVDAMTQALIHLGHGMSAEEKCRRLCDAYEKTLATLSRIATIRRAGSRGPHTLYR